MPDFPLLNFGTSHCEKTITVALIIGLCTACSGFSQAQSEISTPAVVKTSSIVALGRLAPKGEVIKLSVPNAEDSRVNQIFVREGDWVKAGEVIALLQGIERKQRDVEAAYKNVEYYQAKLEQTRLGEAKQAEIAAQEAQISRLKAQLRNQTIERKAALASANAELNQAQLSCQRKQYLKQEGAISQEELELAQEELETARATSEQRKAQLNNTIQTLQEQIVQEQENLAKLREVRPIDLRVAQAELERALVAVEQRKADIEDLKVRVPVSGQILRLNTQVGERVNTQQGIVELGQTDQMYAITEIYETEITKVRLGQSATIVSEYGGFEGEVKGTVEQISLQVGQRTLTDGSSNPTTDENARVVEVKIRLAPEDNSKISRFTNMQVRVTINSEKNHQENH